MIRSKILFPLITALLTTLTLGGGVVLMFYLMLDVWAIPDTMAHSPERAVFFVFIAPVPFLSGGLWGAGMARLIGRPIKPVAKSLLWYWGKTFAATVILLDLAQIPAFGLLPVFQKFIPHTLHYFFTLFFIIGVGAVVALNAKNLIAALELDLDAQRVSRLTGLTAALGFLLTSLFLLYGPGWEVGGPQAGYAYNMIWIAEVCTTVAALASGWALGTALVDSPLAPTQS